MIRPARTTDAQEIAQLWNWMITETLATFTTTQKTPEELAGLISARTGAFLVAEAEERVVGFATFGPFRNGPGYAATSEHSVIVSQKVQKTGLGRQLMEQLETMAAQQGCHVMVAAISSAKPQAAAFHSALGYRETGRMPQVGRKAGQWLDLILMQKILSDRL